MADPAHDGPAMNRIIHQAIRRDLGRFDAALARFSPGERAKAEGLAQMFERFHTQLTYHHEGEERRLWPLLRGKPEDTAEVERFTGEHEDIASALTSARQAFDRLPATDGGDEAAVARRATNALLETASSHFEHEEREMDELCAHADPEALGKAQRQFGRDAGFTESMWFLQWVADDATPEQVSFLRRLIPPPAHAMSRLLAGGRYAKAKRVAWA
ncbi:MAG: hemerythrin domain-containing protein [Propionibacteriales bacterium]|nr:hemerythrin domain-containing protein [Propionibacteriales bacterium]